MVVPFAAGGAGRHARPHRRRAGQRNPRPADRDRERRRRRRHDRREPRRQGRARRLHSSVLGSAVLAQNPTLYKHPAYDPVNDFEPGRAVVGLGARAAGAQGFPGRTTSRSSSPTPRRIRASCNTARPARARAPHLRAAARHADGHQDHPRSLSRRRTRHAGPDRRPDRLHARADFDRDAADQERHREGLRHARPRPRTRAGKYPDRCRARRARASIAAPGARSRFPRTRRRRSSTASPRRRATPSTRRR